MLIGGRVLTSLYWWSVIIITGGLKFPQLFKEILQFFSGESTLNIPLLKRFNFEKKNGYVETKPIIEVFLLWKLQSSKVQRRAAIITTIWKLQKNCSNYLWQVSRIFFFFCKTLLSKLPYNCQRCNWLNLLSWQRLFSKQHTVVKSNFLDQNWDFVTVCYLTGREPRFIGKTCFEWKEGTIFDSTKKIPKSIKNFPVSAGKVPSTLEVEWSCNLSRHF